MTRSGAVAEWLGRGLQSLVQRFESARRLFSYKGQSGSKLGCASVRECRLTPGRPPASPPPTVPRTGARAHGRPRDPRGAGSASCAGRHSRRSDVRSRSV